MPCKEIILGRLATTYNNEVVSSEPKPANNYLKRAAVLIPLFLKNGEVYVLLTVRAKNMRSYGGDVAFPGGMRDKCDEDDVDTATREAWEEIGLPKHDIEIISQGPVFITKTNIMVIPVIGFIPNNFKPNLNVDEVEDSFCVPLLDFLKTDKHCHRIIDRYHLHEFTHNIRNKTYKTWGLTAAICINIATVVFNQKPDFYFKSKL
ncbi:peroxisomal coenzyme A diphosphatase NUDT7-like isoform X2 [Antedon mediterranea]